MKRLFYLILFFTSSKYDYAQVVINETAQGTYTYSTSALGVVSSQTYTAGRFYLLIHMRVRAASTPTDFTVTGTSSTWTEIANVTGVPTANDFFRLKVFRYAPASNVTESLSMSGGGLDEGSVVVLLEITGVPVTGTNGSNAIVQIVTGSADASANPSITMAALSGAGNTVLAFFGNDVNPFGAAPETDWSELSESGFNTPTTGGVFIKRDKTTDNTPSVTASASNWIGVAIELRGGRRIINVN